MVRNLFGLPHGIPSHDKVGRVFSQPNPKESGKAFPKRIYEAGEITGRQIMATDGRTSRRSYDESPDKAAIHVAGAWASEKRLIPVQTETEEKSDGITAIPGPPGFSETEGCIVTIGAMGCQKESLVR